VIFNQSALNKKMVEDNDSIITI